MRSEKSGISSQPQSIKAERELWCREQGLFTVDMFAERVNLSVDQVKRYLRKGPEGYPTAWRDMGVHAWKSSKRQWLIKLGTPPDTPSYTPFEGIAIYPVVPGVRILEWQPTQGTSAISSLLMIIPAKVLRDFPGGKRPKTTMGMVHLVSFALDKPGVWFRLTYSQMPTGGQHDTNRELVSAMEEWAKRVTKRARL